MIVESNWSLINTWYRLDMDQGANRDLRGLVVCITYQSILTQFHCRIENYKIALCKILGSS